MFWRVTVCELLGQILRRQPIAEAPATTTGGPSPRRSKAIGVPSDEVTKLVTASSLRRSPEDRLADGDSASTGVGRGRGQVVLVGEGRGCGP